jgi:hypothetical protein
VLPPGTFRVLDVDLSHFRGNRVDMSLFFRLELVFFDAANTRWTRRANGNLDESTTHPMELDSVQARLSFVADGFHPFVHIERVG